MMFTLLSNVYAYDYKHYQLAREHVKINFNVNSPREMAEGVTNGILMRQPQNKPFKEEYISFLEKIYSSDEIIEQSAKIYMKHYTSEELRYMNKIYSDPKVISYMKKTPIVMQESMIMGQKITKKHEDELMQSLQKRAKELEKLGRK